MQLHTIGYFLRIRELITCRETPSEQEAICELRIASNEHSSHGKEHDILH